MANIHSGWMFYTPLLCIKVCWSLLPNLRCNYYTFLYYLVSLNRNDTTYMKVFVSPVTEACVCVCVCVWCMCAESITGLYQEFDSKFTLSIQ